MINLSQFSLDIGDICAGICAIPALCLLVILAIVIIIVVIIILLINATSSEQKTMVVQQPPQPSKNCPDCGNQMQYIEKTDQWFCAYCREYK